MSHTCQGNNCETVLNIILSAEGVKLIRCVCFPVHFVKQICNSFIDLIIILCKNKGLFFESFKSTKSF